MMNTRERAVYGAFCMEGLRDAGDYGVMLDTWGKGCFELIDAMCHYVDYMGDMVAAVEALPITLDFPGIFEYEVCAEFGEMFGKHVLDTGAEPSREACHAFLKASVVKFFGPESAPALEAF